MEKKKCTFKCLLNTPFLITYGFVAAFFILQNWMEWYYSLIIVITTAILGLLLLAYKFYVDAKTNIKRMKEEVLQKMQAAKAAGDVNQEDILKKEVQKIKNKVAEEIVNRNASKKTAVPTKKVVKKTTKAVKQASKKVTKKTKGSKG
jgi:hypothetical protein